MNTHQKSTPIQLSSFTMEDPFWSREIETVRTEVLPYQWNALNDNVPGAAPSYCMRNYRIAGKLNEQRKLFGQDYGKSKELPFLWGANPEDPANPGDHFYGFVFQDSDFPKWVEAVSYSLMTHPDPELERTADEAIEVVCKAQLENGYLDTYYIISDIDQAFTNLRDAHELYCLGHLVEGACAYYEATGKDRLLNAARRYADYVYDRFGACEGKIHGYPGHEIAEMALVRLSELTGDHKYYELAEYFINERGKRPYFFDTEQGRMPAPEHMDEERYVYHQANKPIRELTEATGHAVRAVYYYSGAADVARLSEDEELFRACDRLFDNITTRRMYVTGGIGSTHMGEAFTYDYDLPNDTAYAETCAAIGLVFFARRMLQIHPSRKYSDIMERALYNGVLSGMALDGKSFFYVNPLEVNPEACKKDERKNHVKHNRQKWFGCACCPPNIARLLTSISAYAYTENEDTLYAHLYIGGTISKKYADGEVSFTIRSEFPWNGKISIRVSNLFSENSDSVHGTLALRVPGWCHTTPMIEGAKFQDGYLYVTRDWKSGDSIAFEFPMEPGILMANTNIREDSGKLCVRRGPVIYCLEEIDNGKNLQNLLLNPDAPLTTEKITIGSVSMVGIEATGLRIEDSQPESELYPEYHPLNGVPCKLHFVPYFAWNNRGEGEMTVWL